jgi:hypothetical protein
MASAPAAARKPPPSPASAGASSPSLASPPPSASPPLAATALAPALAVAAAPALAAGLAAGAFPLGAPGITVSPRTYTLQAGRRSGNCVCWPVGGGQDCGACRCQATRFRGHVRGSSMLRPKACPSFWGELMSPNDTQGLPIIPRRVGTQAGWGTGPAGAGQQPAHLMAPSPPQKVSFLPWQGMSHASLRPAATASSGSSPPLQAHGDQCRCGGGHAMCGMFS